MDAERWIAQILLAGIFFFTGFCKVFAYKRLVRTLQKRWKIKPDPMEQKLAAQLGMLEIVGAIFVIFPYDLWPPHVVVRLAAGGLALLMVAACIYNVRRKEPASPSLTLFLLALFVIVGRWPH